MTKKVQLVCREKYLILLPFQIVFCIGLWSNSETENNLTRKENFEVLKFKETFTDLFFLTGFVKLIKCTILCMPHRVQFSQKLFLILSLLNSIVLPEHSCLYYLMKYIFWIVLKFKFKCILEKHHILRKKISSFKTCKTNAWKKWISNHLSFFFYIPALICKLTGNNNAMFNAYTLNISTEKLSSLLSIISPVYIMTLNIIYYYFLNF